jgi:glucose-1-phosphate thymidylyltransferase
VTYIQQSAPLGLAHAVLVAREFLGDDDFVMYLGDNFIVGGITELVEEFRASRPDAHIMLTAVMDPRHFGVAELDGAGQLIGLEEKPQRPKSDLALVGVYLFTPAVHEAVAGLAPSGRGELEITDAIQWLVRHGRKVTSTVISGYWKDTGNVTDMLEVNRTVLESTESAVAGVVDAASELIGRVVVDTGARVSGSRIVGPAVIGAGTEVTDSYIGPGFDPGSPPHRSLPHRAPCRGDTRPQGAQGAPSGARGSQQGTDQLLTAGRLGRTTGGGTVSAEAA